MLFKSGKPKKLLLSFFRQILPSKIYGKILATTAASFVLVFGFFFIILLISFIYLFYSVDCFFIFLFISQEGTVYINQHS